MIRATDGRVVWDADAYAFLDADCPETVNPSLWRQGQLASIHGLFKVTDGIYQVRGLDLSIMTIVEGDTGVLVIDPLISTECAAAALALYRQHRGERPVRGVLYTHSHVDHFGGVRGVVSAEEVASGRVPVLAPVGFLGHAVSENVYAGGAMTRRATFMYGALLPKGPTGQVGAGLGQTTSTGSVMLIPPTVEIARTDQEETLTASTWCSSRAEHGGAGRAALPVSRAAGHVHGRERHPQPSQPAHAEGRPRPRSARLGAVPG